MRRCLMSKAVHSGLHGACTHRPSTMSHVRTVLSELDDAATPGHHTAHMHTTHSAQPRIMQMVHATLNTWLH